MDGVSSREIIAYGNYPQNLYSDIFKVNYYRDLPDNAEETIEYVIKFLTEEEKKVIEERYKNRKTWVDIEAWVKKAQSKCRNALKKLEYWKKVELLQNGLSRENIIKIKMKKYANNGKCTFPCSYKVNMILAKNGICTINQLIRWYIRGDIDYGGDKEVYEEMHNLIIGLSDGVEIIKKEDGVIYMDYSKILVKLFGKREYYMTLELNRELERIIDGFEDNICSEIKEYIRGNIEIISKESEDKIISSKELVSSALKRYEYPMNFYLDMASFWNKYEVPDDFINKIEGFIEEELTEKERYWVKAKYEEGLLGGEINKLLNISNSARSGYRHCIKARIIRRNELRELLGFSDLKKSGGLKKEGEKIVKVESKKEERVEELEKDKSAGDVVVVENDDNAAIDADSSGSVIGMRSSRDYGKSDDFDDIMKRIYIYLNGEVRDDVKTAEYRGMLKILRITNKIDTDLCDILIKLL